jgi:quinol monooxygenase YgiN
METTIQAIVSMNVPAANLQALQQLIPSINERVQSGEPETLLYRWYLSEDGTACHLHESFPSKKAFSDHLKNVEPVLEELFGLAPITGCKIYGNISNEMKKGLREFGKGSNIMPEFSHYLSGFVRQSSKVFTGDEVH